MKKSILRLFSSKFRTFDHEFKVLIGQVQNYFIGTAKELFQTEKSNG